jgi:ADP-ribose pyrophosphatase
VHGLAEEHENIRVVVKTLAEMEALLDQGAIESGHTIIGLYWLPPLPSPFVDGVAG